jgi:integrase
MGRARKGLRVLGPYYQQERERWQVRTAGNPGEKIHVEYFASESKAKAFAAECKKTQAGVQSTIETLERWEISQYNRGILGKSVETVRYSILHFVNDILIDEITPQYLQQRIDERLAAGKSIATVAQALVNTKTFLKWCNTRGYLAKIPDLNGVKVEGYRPRGKEQLTVDESRLFLESALERTPRGLMASLALVMGLRSGEIRKMQRRQLDAEGTIIRVVRGKTRNSVRAIEVPELLQPHLLEQAKGKESNDLLFPNKRGKPWCCNTLLLEVRAICQEAGVPEVCVHGLRGTFASLAESAGVASHAVAATLGHANDKITHGHYTKPEIVDGAKVRRATLRLVGY